MSKTAIATSFVIRNANSVDDDGPLYWNNDSGWGCYATAQKYENTYGTLPIDGVWQHAYDGVNMLNGDEAWFGRLQEKKFTQDTLFAANSNQPGVETLKQKLIAHAGAAAVMPVFEADLENLLSRRCIFINGGNHRMGEGEACKCHGNAAALWDQDAERYDIYTGYGMSDDGVWRQHSWAYDNTDKLIVETTEPRIAYYGFALTLDESAEFFEANYYH